MLNRTTKPDGQAEHEMTNNGLRANPTWNSWNVDPAQRLESSSVDIIHNLDTRNILAKGVTGTVTMENSRSSLEQLNSCSLGFVTLKRNLRIAAGDVSSQEQCSIVLDTGYFSMGWRDLRVR